MLYVLVDAIGDPLADPDSGEPYEFRSPSDARLFARPGETVAGWIIDPEGPPGARKTVPVRDLRDR